MQLEMALCQLRGAVDADEVLFWGKITGLNADYYIALAVTFQGKFEFAHKQFYWTLSTSADLKFREMPGLGLPMAEQDKFIDSCATYFLGEPNKALNQKDGDDQEAEPPVEEEAENLSESGSVKKDKDSEQSDEEEIKVPKRNLTEVHRLSYIVNAIENDCHTCPMGAFKMTPEHELRRAEAFRGLDKEQAVQLGNYQHFRNVQ